jgi:hypothetical protein
MYETFIEFFIARPGRLSALGAITVPSERDDFSRRPLRSRRYRRRIRPSGNRRHHTSRHCARCALSLAADLVGAG